MQCLIPNFNYVFMYSGNIINKENNNCEISDTFAQSHGSPSKRVSLNHAVCFIDDSGESLSDCLIVLGWPYVLALVTHLAFDAEWLTSMFYLQR